MTSIINIIYEHNYFYLFTIIFIFFFQLPIYLICLNRFSLSAHLVFEHYLSIKFTTTRLYYLNCKIVTTFRFFIKSPEEGRLVRPKYRETSSRFSLCSFAINVYTSLGLQSNGTLYHASSY